MVALSDYCENELLDHIMTTGDWTTAPTGTWCKLHIGDPGEDGTANAAAETTRQSITWGAAAARAISNSASVDWTNVSTAETYTHVSIWDTVGPAGGNMIAYGALTASQAVNAGDDFSIAVGDLDIDFADDPLTNYAANSALDFLTGRADWTVPPGTFVKLHLGDPGADATSNPAAETTRANGGAFSAAVGGTADNDAVISWTSVAATETVTHISIWDAVSAGNPLWFGALGSSKNLTSGQDAQFAAGTLDVTLT